LDANLACQAANRRRFDFASVIVDLVNVCLFQLDRELLYVEVLKGLLHEIAPGGAIRKFDGFDRAKQIA
jgi:hypothetical protein